MSPVRKLAAIFVADVVGYSRLAGIDEDQTLARLRTLRSDLLDPTIAVHRGRIVKRTGDGAIVEFRSVVDAVRCAVELQNGMAERNSGLSEDHRIDIRIGVHIGDVVEEIDRDLMGDGVNIAARLEGVAKPGRICLSEDAYRQVRAKLDLEVGDIGPIRLKNIAEPIRAYSIGAGEQRTLRLEASRTLGKAAPPRLSIVVLPFANLSGDTNHDYFVDGVTESLTTDLSRISGSFVIARNTAIACKDSVADAKQIGRDLNVRYVLEGSIQRGDGRMRVNVQLSEAESGKNLWADRFDKPIVDLFELQDQIVARLANTLKAQLIAAEAHRAEQTPEPDSLDLCFQGLACVNKSFAPQNLAQARDYFERSVAVDDSNVEALVGIGTADAITAGGGGCDDRAARAANAEAVLRRALALAPDHAFAHYWLGTTLLHDDRAERAISQFERALELSPSMASAHAGIGRAKMFLGRPEELESHLREALRLNPRNVFVFMTYAYIGYAKLYLGEYQEAVTWLRRSVQSNPNSAPTHLSIAAAHALLGHTAEASAALEAALSLAPNWTLSRARSEHYAFSSNRAYRAFADRLLEALRIAGAPER